MILYTELFCGQADIFLPAGSVNSTVRRRSGGGQELKAAAGIAVNVHPRGIPLTGISV